MGGPGARTTQDTVRVGTAAFLGLVLIVAGCGGSDDDREEVRGIVLEVEGDLTSVESFLLRTDDGEVLRVVPAPDGDFRFPLPHLHDHRRTGEPLLVELDRSYDPPLATAIQDADDPAWHGEPRTEPGPQDAGNQEMATRAGEEDTRAVPPATEETPAVQEPAPSTDPSSGTDPGGADEPGEPPATTAVTTSTTSATEGTAEETVEESDVHQERDVREETPDSPERPGTAPEGTGDGADQAPIEDEEEPEQPAGPVIDLVIIDGRLEGGARRESVAVGEMVTIRVSGNSDDEVHVHGYDLFIDLVDGAGELTFEASIPGVFEIELEGPHTLLVRLEVS